MLWKTSPAATELEEVVLGWLRQLLGLPPGFEGVIYDTASVATLHALAAARDVAVPNVRARGLAGRPDVPPLRVYCSEQAHSSIDKATILLGMGHAALRKTPVDEAFRLRPEALRSAIAEDRSATAGLLSTTKMSCWGARALARAVADFAAADDGDLHRFSFYILGFQRSAAGSTACQSGAILDSRCTQYTRARGSGNWALGTGTEHQGPGTENHEPCRSTWRRSR